MVRGLISFEKCKVRSVFLFQDTDAINGFKKTFFPGDCVVTLKHSVENSCEWARLENKEKTTVSDYIDKIEESDGKMTSDGSKSNGYLFDWSLPLHCPKLVEKLRIPRYFAGKICKIV